MRVSKPPDERRAELLRAARELFDEKGVGATRVSDIVKRVGVAQGVFYYYFKSKDEVVDLILRQTAQETHHRCRSLLEGEQTFLEKLSAFIDLCRDLVDQFLADGATSLGDMIPPDRDRPRFQQQRAVLLDTLKELARQGRADGSIQLDYPVETAQVLFYGILALAAEKIPERKVLAALVEQGLHLPRGCLPAGGEEKGENHEHLQ